MHQHFNASDSEEMVVLVMKAKPLFLFMHMVFQRKASMPPEEPMPGCEDWPSPEDC